MQEVLNNVKKYYRNGKIAFLVISLVLAIGIFFLSYFLLRMDDWIIILFAFLPLIILAISIGIGFLIQIPINSKIKNTYWLLSKYNSSTTAEERQKFIEDSKTLFSKEKSKAKKLSYLTIPAIIATIILSWVVASEDIFPNWLLYILIPIVSFEGIIIGYHYIYRGVNYDKNKEKLLTHCPKCYSFHSLSTEKKYDRTEYDKDSKWEDCYGTTGEIYADGQKVGSVYGRTGSIRYERESTWTYYKNVVTCKYCDYKEEYNTQELKLGEWR